ncbi:MlaD family protein [Nocardia beijingensis]|uniref:MlaD family protein n=1 Tax=Nocardia beijingensis TaxID=95162 RepID=UPI00344DB320
MRSARASALRFAGFVVIVAVTVVLIVQAIHRPVPGRTTTFTAVFSDVFGLRTNADVRLRGVAIGKVVAIDLGSDSRARVRFTVQDSHPLLAGDTIAVKFQSLTGQRYLAVLPGTDTAPRDPSTDIPVERTQSSLDITQLFNGLQPVLREADPAIYNRLTENFLALLQGDSDAAVGPILGDIAALSAYATDRAQVFRIILANLDRTAGVLSGQSKSLATGLEIFGTMFDAISGQLEKLLSMINQGAAEFAGVDRLLDSLQILLLGGSDRLEERATEALADPAAAVEALRVLPALIEGLSRALPNTAADLQCSKGNASLPGLANVLLSGQQVVLCNR